MAQKETPKSFKDLHDKHETDRYLEKKIKMQALRESPAKPGIDTTVSRRIKTTTYWKKEY